jgi:hypothetical protein
MTHQYCVGDNLSTNTSCGCFDDLDDIRIRSEELGVALPVLCFGEKCSLERTYKTGTMVSKPCNITVCRQYVSDIQNHLSPNSSQTIYCGGHFYDNQGQFDNLISVSVSPPQETLEKTSNDPFYAYIVIGVAALMFVLLVYLMFSTPPKKPKDTLVNLQSLSSKSTPTAY